MCSTATSLGSATVRVPRREAEVGDAPVFVLPAELATPRHGGHDMGGGERLGGEESRSCTSRCRSVLKKIRWFFRRNEVLEVLGRGRKESGDGPLVLWRASLVVQE